MWHFIIYTPWLLRKSIFQRLFTGSLPRVESIDHVKRSHVDKKLDMSHRWPTQFHKDQVRPDKGQPNFPSNKAISLLNQGHGVSDFQQDVWSNISRYCMGRKEKCRYQGWDTCPPQGQLVNGLVSALDITSQQLHQRLARQAETTQVFPSPNICLCQSHPHIYMTCSPGCAFFVSGPGLVWFPDWTLFFLWCHGSYISLLKGNFLQPLPNKTGLDVNLWTSLPLPLVSATCHAILIITGKTHIVGD